MKTTRFQTDRRLWFWITAALFVIIWCIPFLWVKGPTSPFDISRELVADLIHGWLPIDNIVNGFMGLTVLALILGIPAVILAWVIQCVIVVLRTKLRDKNRGRIGHAA